MIWNEMSDHDMKCDMKCNELTWDEMKLYAIKWNWMNEWNKMKLKLNGKICMNWKAMTWKWE